MRSLQGRTSLATRAMVPRAAKEYLPDADPIMPMGDEVPTAVRFDPEFNVLFRESQKIKNSRRPADQEALREMLNKMRARWGELTGESNAC